VSTIFGLIKRLLAASTYFVFTIKLRITVYLKIRILGQHKKFHIHKNSERKDSPNVAIVALYPRKAILISALRLIDQLIVNEYHVVAVLNGRNSWTDSWLDELNQRNLTILIRPNIGRDFGAYQAGIRYAQMLPSHGTSKRLIITNDSMYFFPTSKDFLDDLLSSTHDWFGMFVNYQFHVHAQSFFESFSSKVFLGNEFINFWENYYPTNIRHNVINKGEVGLTKKLIKGGFIPHSFVSPSLIESSKKFKGFRVEDKYALWSGFGFSEIDLNDNSQETHSLKLKIIFSTQNATHHAALLGTRVLGIPMKLDLLRTGLASLDDILKIARNAGLSGGELYEFESEMVAKGSSSSYTGLRKLWHNFGYE